MNSTFSKEQLYQITEFWNIEMSYFFYKNGQTSTDFIDDMIIKYPEHKDIFLNYKNERNNSKHIDKNLQDLFVNTFVDKIDIIKDIDLWFPQVFPLNSLRYQRLAKKELFLFDHNNTDLIKEISRKSKHFGFYDSYLQLNNKILDADIVSSFVRDANTQYDNATDKLFNVLIQLPKNEQTFFDLEFLYFKTEESTHKIIAHLNTFDKEIKKNSNIQELINNEFDMEETIEYVFTIKLNSKQIAMNINKGKGATKECLTNFFYGFSNYLGKQYKIFPGNIGFNDDEVAISLRSNNMTNIDTFKIYSDYIKKNTDYFYQALQHKENRNSFHYFLMQCEIPNNTNQIKKQKL